MNGGVSFALRYWEDSGSTWPPMLYVGWDGGRSSYHYLIELDAVKQAGKWCYNIDLSTGGYPLYGEEVRITTPGILYSNAHAGQCTLSAPTRAAGNTSKSCCTLQTVEYCVEQTGSPMSWGGELLSATWGDGSYKVPLVPSGSGFKVAASGCISCGSPRNETTCVGQWS